GLSEVSGEKAVGCGFGGVKLLGIGGVTQEFPEARGLRSGGTERVLHLFGRELEEASGRGRGGDCAGRASCMEDLVMRPAEEFSHADANFITSDNGGEQFAARTAERLCDGEC